MSPATSERPTGKRSPIDRFLDIVERVGNALPDEHTSAAPAVISVIPLNSDTVPVTWTTSPSATSTPPGA